MNREGNQTNKLLRKQWHRKEHKYYKNKSTKHMKEFERKVIVKICFPYWQRQATQKRNGHGRVYNGCVPAK